nr:nuclear protein 1 isoform X1 [Chrysemys picta bellii]
MAGALLEPHKLVPTPFEGQHFDPYDYYSLTERYSTQSLAKQTWFRTPRQRHTDTETSRTDTPAKMADARREAGRMAAMLTLPRETGGEGPQPTLLVWG